MNLNKHNLSIMFSWCVYFHLTKLNSKLKLSKVRKLLLTSVPESVSENLKHYTTKCENSLSALIKSSPLEVFCEKGVGLQLYQKETPKQVLSCTFGKILKSTF